MARAKVDTVRTNVYLTSEAAELLKQLAPSENKRGQYLSDLILEAARRAGIVETPPASARLDLAVLQRQLREAQRTVQDLQTRVDTALDQQGK